MDDAITMDSAFEIVTHPTDLSIAISQSVEEGGFAFAICRGPRQSFKPIVTTGFFAETHEEAVKGVAGVLHAVREAVVSQFPHTESSVMRHLNGKDAGVVMSGILSEEKIARILDVLSEHSQVYTKNSMLSSDVLDPLFKVQ